MKVLIMTNRSLYGDFLDSAVANYRNSHDIYVIDERKYITDFASYDVGISFMYRYKVPKSELDKAPWFNFHPAPLPEYKGRDLCYHAIVNGEEEFGATLHYMDEGFDTGDIIEVNRFPLYPKDTAEDISELAIRASKVLFCEYLPKILETRVFPRTPNVGGTYYKKGQIIEEIPVKPDEPFGQFVRAVTYKDHHPRIDIGGVKYEVRRVK